ncbi:MAG: SDR family NAD(P)-dependent oxidoreductase [Bilophila sp.]
MRGLIEAEGRKAVLLPGDLSDESYCSRLAAKARDGLGGLDILALVAGHQVASPSIEEITTQQLEKVFAVNVFSIFSVLRPALSFLPAGTSIILTSSIEAVNPNATLPDYATTKGAIKALSGSLAKQLAPKGIRVNAVAPGPVWTALPISGGQLDEKIPNSVWIPPSSAPDSPWSWLLSMSCWRRRRPASSAAASTARPEAKPCSSVKFTTSAASSAWPEAKPCSLDRRGSPTCRPGGFSAPSSSRRVLEGGGILRIGTPVERPFRRAPERSRVVYHGTRKVVQESSRPGAGPRRAVPALP